MRHAISNEWLAVESDPAPNACCQVWSCVLSRGILGVLRLLVQSITPVSEPNTLCRTPCRNPDATLTRMLDQRNELVL